MDIKSLMMFQHLANSLHFGKTANACHVSPSTLSRSIQRLEEELNCQLLIRDNRSVFLTDAGNKLLDYAEQQIDQLRLLKTSLNKSQKQLSGRLNIYCSVTAAYSHLPPLLDKFRRAHPLVEINLDTGDAADAFEQIQTQQVDLAIAAQSETIEPNIYFHTIASIPMAIIAPTINCVVKQQLQQHPIDWAKLPVILPEHGTARKRFEQWFRKKQVGKPNVYAKVSGHEALVSMVALGCGIGIAPLVVIENSPVKDRLEQLPETHIEPFDLGLVCLKNRLDNPLLNEFIAVAANSNGF